MRVQLSVVAASAALVLGAIASQAQLAKTPTPGPALPAPYATPSSTNFSKLIGWPQGKTPVAPAGFEVTLFAENLDHPRWLYVLPNGDVLVAESRTEPSGRMPQERVKRLVESGHLGKSANRITLLRDTDRDGRPELRTEFLSKLNQPLGMALLGDGFYVADTDALLRFPYQSGQTRLTASPAKILALPAGGYNNHWTRNVVARPDGKKLYVSVGSGSNVMENGAANEVRRASILEVNPDGSGERIYADGLRNPVGMDWAADGALWTAVNERDGLGDDLVPDYLTGVREGAFYGWPYAYFGPNEDPRRKGERPDLVAKSVAPDYALGSHTASLGLAFYRGSTFPASYRGGAFVGQHGSWNRSTYSGYKVVFVPFKDGKPNGPTQDFLTGFIADEKAGQVYGRPVGLAVLGDGSLLVADDAGNKIWRVSANAAKSPTDRQ